MAAEDGGGWARFFSELTALLVTCDQQYGLANEDLTEYLVDHLSISCQSVQAIHDRLAGPGQGMNELDDLKRDVCQLLEDLRLILQIWSDYSEALATEHASSSYVAPLEEPAPPYFRRGRGRPRFDISREQLQYLRSLSFSWTSISHMLMVSRMTIYRRRAEFGLLSESHSSISENELLTTVQQIVRDHPQVGQSFVLGRLRSLGYQVTRDRVRQTMRICDPLNTALRWHGGVTRRPYSVPGPNSLWHIGED